jgi:dipeptidyl aminopeptidase/acylaminoacyl peptidase
VSTAAPYGTWESALTPDLLFQAATGLAELRRDGDRLTWLELRAGEGGRQVLVQRSPDGAHTELLPPDANARTRVHEYGGGVYLVVDGTAWYVNFQDQRLYRAEPGEEPRPITPEPPEPAALRYADLELTGDGAWLLAVRERHEGPEATDVHNEVVAIPTDGSAADGDAEVVVLVSGRDFVSSPRLSPDGSRLAYVAWDHPNMPWDDTELLVGRFSVADGTPVLSEVTTIAGGSGTSESVMAPAWSPEGILHLLSDRTGWWNLYRADAAGAGPVASTDLTNLAEVKVDLGIPAWQFHPAPYGFLDDGRIAVIATDHAVMRPSLLDPADGALTGLAVPHTACGGLVTRGSTVTFIGGSPSHPGSVVEVDAARSDAVLGPQDDPVGDGEGPWRTLHASRELPVGTEWLTEPEGFSFPTSDGMTAHALYHRPRNPRFQGPEDELPPLIVTSHGGPTAHVPPQLDLPASFWTSRGFAVVDVNYRGSTGFGREYREALRGTWGIYDVDDCVAAAQALADRGEVDPDRMVIRGGSASGFTTLAALTFRDVFAAGASYFGVADLGALAEHTHKFESRYLDRLIGPYPEAEERYRERSPVYHPEGLSCPVILLQGMLDRIVPPAQAEDMIEAMAAKGIPYAYVVFDDEDHGFRKADNNITALTSELSFYAQVFGFDPADDITPVEVIRPSD